MLTLQPPPLELVSSWSQAEIERAYRNLTPEEQAEVDRLLAGPPSTSGAPDFLPWLETVSPAWDWRQPHLAHTQKYLERVTEGECKRLMIFMPPRHGKSEQSTIRYPVYRMVRKGDTRACVGCYNQRFAERFGRRSRKIAERLGFVSRERSAMMEWETDAGGVYRSCGVGSVPTGEGFDLIVIDDPVKSREEAESDAYRERAWEWYGDLYTRREPGAAIVLIQTRWHEDDLAGRLLKAAQNGGDQWEVICLPALAETQSDRDFWAEKWGLPLGQPDPVGRKPGEALWSARFDVPELTQTKAVKGAYAFGAEYQQRPSAREGKTFKREWFKIIPARPVGTSVRCWDLAATDGDGDFTVGLLLTRMADGKFAVSDVKRGQWGPGDRDAIILQTAQIDRSAVEIQIEQEGGSGGKSQVHALIAKLAGFTVRGIPSTGSKETRADPVAAQAAVGNIVLVQGPWNEAFLDELCAFPTGGHDDQVDALSGAFERLISLGDIKFFI